MSPKLKQLVAGLVAVVALSLVASSAASAAQFTSGQLTPTYHATGGGSSGTFHTEGGTTKCNNISASGVQGESSSTAKVTSTFSECTSFGLVSPVSMNGCYGIMHVSSGSGDKYKGSGDLVCPAGKEVVIAPTVFGSIICEIRIPAQAGSSQLEFVDDTSNSRLEIKLTSSTIHYSSTGSTCGSAGEKTDGKIENPSPALVGGKEKSLAVS